jgi:hypothetical protein
VSPSLISNVTEAVQDEVRAWQNRPLDPIYPIVYMDALYVRMRDSGHVQNRAVYVAIGVNLEGYKEVLGLWTSPNEGAKFWLQVLTQIKNRGVQDVFIACVDGLKGFSGGDRNSVSADPGATVHCAPGEAQLELRVLEAAPASSFGATADLHGTDGRGGRPMP